MREKIGVERTTITFSLPVDLKKQIEYFILSKNLKSDERESVSYFCFRSVKCYLQIQKIDSFEDLMNIWGCVFINNNNISLNKKLDFLKEFGEEIKREIEELEKYFSYKKLKNLEDESIAKIESLGEMASWVLEDMRRDKNK